MDDLLNNIGNAAKGAWNTVAQDFGHVAQVASDISPTNIAFNLGAKIASDPQTYGELPQSPLPINPNSFAQSGDFGTNLLNSVKTGMIGQALNPQSFFNRQITGIGANGEQPSIPPFLGMGGGELAGVGTAVGHYGGQAIDLLSQGLKKGLLPFGDTSGIQPDAAKTLQGLIPKIQENRVNYDDPSYMANTLLPEKDWNTFLDKHPEINNHGDTYAGLVKGPDALREMNGYLGYISTDKGAIPLDDAQRAAVIDNRVVGQWTANNGDQELAIVRRNPDFPTSYDVIDRHHGIPAARAIGLDKIPAIILHKDAPPLSEVYDALKSGRVAPVDIKGGLPLDEEAANQKTLQGAIGGEASLTPDRIQELAPELTTPKGKSQVQSILDKATNAQPALDERFAQIAKDAGLNPETDFESRIKKPDTFIQKVAQHRLEGTDEYTASGVNDPYGGRFIASTAGQKGQIISQINQMDRDGELKILKQQQVTKDTYSAYHIDFVKNGVKGEIQIHDPNSLLESVVNHEIRAQAGEKPPPDLAAEKQANARASQEMPPQAAQALAQAEEKAKASGQPSILGTDVTNQPPPGVNKPGYTPPGGDTKNQVNLTINGTSDNERIQSAIVNSERVKNELNVRGKDAYTAGQKLSDADKSLAELYQHGASIEELAKQAQNPKAFTNFMNKLTDYYDFRLSTDRAVGGDTARRADYIHQYWDLSKPEDLAKFNELATQKGVRPWDGFSSQPRVFDTYAEGEAAGLTRLNPNIVEDLKDDYGAASTALSRRTLQQGLAQAVPDKVAGTGIGKTDQGKPFINSNIPGLEGMAFHPDVFKRLQGFQPLSGTDLFSQIKDKGFIQGLKDTGTLNTIASLYDHASQPMKQFLLNFSGFHSLNISGNYTGASIFHPVAALRGLAESVPSFFSEGLTQRIEDGFKNKMVSGKDYSVFDAGLRSGVNMDRGLPAQGLQRINPFTMLQRAMFDRELHTLKLNLVDQAFGNGKLDPASPQGAAVGQEITSIMGEINTRTMNVNPNAMKWAGRAFLAPQFTISKYKMLGDVLKGGDAGNLARTAVFGKSLVMGTIATLGTALATGNYPNLQQILTNYTTNPAIQTNLTNPSGNKQDVRLPTTFLAEPARPIMGLLQGSTDELLHYGQARLNPVISGIQTALTGKDYYGRPIVNPNSSTPPGLQMAKNIGISKLPIGVQAVVNTMQGKTTPTQAAIQIGGLRTTTNPDQPVMKYFANLKAARPTDVNDQARWDSLHPQTKDANGDPLPDSKVLTPQKLSLIFSSPGMLKAEQQLRASEPTPTDPKFAGAKAYSDGVIKALADNKANANDISVWNTLHEAKLDGKGQPLIDDNGVPIYTKGTMDTAQHAGTYLNGPQGQKMQAVERQLYQAGLNKDPLWGLPPQQAAMVLASEDKVPGQKTTYSSMLQTQAWYPQFLQDRSQYYQSLPAQTSQTQTQPGQLARPIPDAATQTALDAKQWNNPNVQGYFQALDAFNNQQLQQMNLPPTAGAVGGGLSKRGLSSRLSIKGSGATSTKGKAVAKASTSGGKMLAGGGGKGKMIAGRVKVPNMKVPKVKFRGGTAGKVKGLTAKVSTANVKIQQPRMLPIQRVNLKQLGGGQHSKRYGKYAYP